MACHPTLSCCSPAHLLQPRRPADPALLSNRTRVYVARDAAGRSVTEVGSMRWFLLGGHAWSSLRQRGGFARHAHAPWHWLPFIVDTLIWSLSTLCTRFVSFPLPLFAEKVMLQQLLKTAQSRSASMRKLGKGASSLTMSEKFSNFSFKFKKKRTFCGTHHPSANSFRHVIFPLLPLLPLVLLVGLAVAAPYLAFTCWACVTTPALHPAWRELVGCCLNLPVVLLAWHSHVGLVRLPV